MKWFSTKWSCCFAGAVLLSPWQREIFHLSLLILPSCWLSGIRLHSCLSIVPGFAIAFEITEYRGSAGRLVPLHLTSCSQCAQLVVYTLVITKGYGVRATTIEGQNAYLQRCALCTFTWQMVKTRVIRLRVTEGPNARDQIRVMYIPFILNGRPYECCVHAWDACILTTCWLGLRATRGARNQIPKPLPTNISTVWTLFY